jgi:hypothetical protein
VPGGGVASVSSGRLAASLIFVPAAGNRLNSRQPRIAHRFLPSAVVSRNRVRSAAVRQVARQGV